nr:uncharacterized protein LOC111417198 [Onthophagus taurus]
MLYCAFNLFSIIILMFQYSNACITVSHDEIYKKLKTVASTLNDLNSTVDNYYDKLKDVSDIIKKVIRNFTKKMKRDMYGEVSLEITKNRKIIENVVETIENNHQKALQELAGVNKEVKSIGEVADIDKNQIIMNRTRVNEFVGELKGFTDFGKSIERMYVMFLNIYGDPSLVEDRNIYEFIDYCLGNDDFNMGPVLNNMLNNLIDEHGVFNLMKRELVEKYVVASRRKSTLEYLSNLALYMAVSEVRCSMMATNAKGLIRFLRPGTLYNSQLNSYMKKMTERLNLLALSVQIHARQYSGRYWVGDTENNKIGYQYVNFYNIFKGLSLRNKDCDSIGKKIVSNGTRSSYDYCDKYNKHKCKGTIHCSSNIHLITDVHICYSKKNETRLYDYVSYTAKEKRDCSGTKETIKKDSKCVNCECYCDHKQADKYISLDEMVTDVANNRVLTGIRFNKHNGVIGLDIEESELNDNGYIMEGTSKWIINKGVDKFELKHPDKREIHLSGIETDNHRVITGVRFHEVEDGVELHVRITDLISCSISKTILSSSSNWINNDKKREYSINLEKDKVGHPSQAEREGPVAIQNFSKSRVRVSATSFEEDGAQTVIPFFDVRKVTPSKPMLLRGIGLVYKRGSNKYGGFIAPYIVLTDYSNQIDNDFLEIMARSYSSGLSIFIIKMSWVLIVVNCVVLLVFFG